MTNDEILTKIREGLGMQMDEAIEQPVNAILYHDLHMVTQSWLLLQILEKLNSIDDSIIAMATDNEGIISAIRDNMMGRI